MRNFIALSFAVLTFVASSNAFAIEKATPGQFKFYAILDITNKDSKMKAACAATLINEEWLITTAKCLNGASGVSVHLGNYPSDGHFAVDVGLNGLYPHPKYDHSLALHDIGKHHCLIV